MNSKTSYRGFFGHLLGTFPFGWACVSDLGSRNVISVNKYKE